MIAYFQMSKQSVSEQLLVPDVPYKVGEECNYWLKFGDYVQQQAVEAEWLVEGRLTPKGLQAIDSDREMVKKREEITRFKAQSLKGKTQARGIRIRTRFSQKQKVKSGFISEVKALLSKTEIGFIHFEEAGDNSRLRVKVPTERGGTTSKTFTGSESDIRRDLDEFLDEIEENLKRKHR